MIPEAKRKRGGLSDFLVLLVLMCLIPMVYGQKPAQSGKGFYAISTSTKPPTLAIVDAAELKVVGSIPLDQDLADWTMRPASRFLYLLYAPEDEPGRLTILDLKERRAVEQIPLGRRPIRPRLSVDMRFLICLSLGRAAGPNSSGEPSRVTIVDTSSNKVAGAFSIGPAMGSGRDRLGFGYSTLVTTDPPRLIVLSPTTDDQGSFNKTAVSVFDIQRKERLAEIVLENPAVRLILSPDERWIYAVGTDHTVLWDLLSNMLPLENFGFFSALDLLKDLNPVGTPATVQVIDLESLKLSASHEFGKAAEEIALDPTTGILAVMIRGDEETGGGKLYEWRGTRLVREVDVRGFSVPVERNRLSFLPGTLVATCDQIIYLGGGAATPVSIEPAPEEDGNPAGRLRNHLGGCPTMMMEIPGQDRVVMALRKQEGKTKSIQKLAFVNLDTKRLERVVSYRRKRGLGEKIAIGALIPLVLPLAAAAAMGDAWKIERTDYLSLAVEPVGTFIYVYDRMSHRVAVVRSQDGSVVNRVGVHANSRRLSLGPEGRFVCVEAPEEIALIDTRTNRKHSRYKVEGTQTFTDSLYMDEINKRILVLSGRALFVIDAGTGELLAEVRGFRKGRSLLPQSKLRVVGFVPQ